MLDEAGNGKGGQGKPYPAVTQPLWNMLAGISKEDRTVGSGNPLRSSGSSSLEGSKKGLLEGRNALNSTPQAHQHYFQPEIWDMGVVEKKQS